MKIVIFTKNDFIGNVAYSAGEICGWPDHVADRLIAKGFAKLYGDGKVKEVGGRIDGAEDYWTNPQLAAHKAELEKSGKWKPSPPIAVRDAEVERAERERARNEFNQL